MKAKLIITAMLFYCMSDFAQVQLNNGPELENDRDNKMNRMLGGDDNSYYCYRIRSKGKGTSFFIEKYNKKTLKPEFSKEVATERPLWRSFLEISEISPRFSSLGNKIKISRR